MKNIYDVLRQKELELQQLQRDVEALRVAARLLVDDNESSAPTVSPIVTATSRTPAMMAKPADSGFAAGQPGVRQFP